jgi:hypothetical protein
VYHGMLGGDPVTCAVRPVAGATRPPVVLPPDLADFTGRAEPLSRLDTLMTAEEARIVLVTGIIGIGKTSLAVHAAALAQRRFPGGRIFLNARTEQGAVRSSRSVLQDLVRFAGVAVPDGCDCDELSGRWQHWLMDRQVLLVFDDAATAQCFGLCCRCQAAAWCWPPLAATSPGWNMPLRWSWRRWNPLKPSSC